MRLTDQLDSVSRLFLDTAPVIYFVEKNPAYLEKSQAIFTRLDERKITAVVSPITLSECLVLPYRLNNAEIAQIFTDLMVNSESVLFYPIDESTADKAAYLRARYNLTLTDAIQFAVALQTNCDAFLTNDVQLKRVEEILVIVLAEAE
ncbi:MAG: type II toxin-antitoxin system VapC family toxin [Chloroflexota bacterium]